MKKLAFTLLSALALAGGAWAGPLTILPAKPVELRPAALFRPQEWFLEGYGSYLIHNASDCGCGTGNSEGFGGGLAVGYYFAYYVGARLDANFSSVDASQTTLGGDILIRYPIPNTHVAPYAFVGGGADFFSGGDSPFFRAGGGFEWRIKPHFGLFAEGGYAWLSSDTGLDNVLVKVGVRCVY